MGLAVERPWLALGGLYLSFFTQMGLAVSLLAKRGLHFCQSMQVVICGELVTIESLLMSGCGLSHESEQDAWWQEQLGEVLGIKTQGIEYDTFEGSTGFK